MKMKKVRAMDLNISAVGLGCWAFSGENQWDDYDDSMSIQTIHQALDLGINFFDVAPVYGLGHAEKVLGQALKERNVNRADVIIASKVGLVWDAENRVTNNLTKESIMKEIDDSLERLQTDYIDLYQIHWPDPNTPIQETMLALNEVQKSGKIKYIGVSNFSLALTKEAMQYAEVASFQGLYNMIERNPSEYHTIPLGYRAADEILPLCEKEGMAFLPYSPLFQGLLTGSFTRTNNFSDQDVRANNPKLSGDRFDAYYELVEELKAFSDEIGKPLNQVAMNWLIQQDAVTSVICGAQTPEQMVSNAKAVEWALTAEQMNQLNAMVEKSGLHLE
ncbi:aldo/keto reductase [Marinicrinis sediminis]|uniref:Aldo/keto reductase n=1 Tax=Marinicrinis sediminis TaxID=1652465 RepID=A0ABW5R845_9BACL